MQIVKYLVYFTAVIYPLGQLFSITLPSHPEVRLNLLDLSVGLTAAGWLIAKPPQLSRLKADLPAFFPFVAAAILALLLNLRNYAGEAVIVGSLYLVRFSAYAAFYGLMRDLLAMKLLTKAKVTLLLIAVGLATACFGLIQYWLYPNLRNLWYLGWDPHDRRLFGTLLDPQFLGIILALTLILLNAQTKQIFAAKSLAIGIISLALLLTFSRSSYLASLGGLAVLAYTKKNSRVNYLKIAGAAFLLVSLFLFVQPAGITGNLLRKTTVDSRIQSWRQGGEIWRRRPLFGIGFNMLRYRNDHKPISFAHSAAGIENSWLFILATGGLVGLFAYLYLWIRLLKREEATGLAIAAAVFIHALFNNTLFYPWVLWWLWVYYSSSKA